MAKYKKNMILNALKFWKNKLNESDQTVESEEDQKKEAAAKQAEEEQAEIDSTESNDDSDVEDDSNYEIPDDAADDENSDDEGSDDDSDEDDSDDEGSDDDSDEDDSNEDSENETFKLEITAPSKKLLDAIPELCKKFSSKISIRLTGTEDGSENYTTEIECEDEDTLDAVKKEEVVKNAIGGMDSELNESLQYEPNTVGAVIKLLSKSDPRDFLFIRLAPNMKQCMIYDIDRSVIVDGQSTTYMEIVIGDPNK